MDEERELSIALPEAGEAEPLVAKPRELFIDLSRDGRFTLSGSELDSEELEDALRQAALANPGSQSVIIRAHRDTLWENVVQLMNLCNKVGIRDYRLTTLED